MFYLNIHITLYPYLWLKIMILHIILLVLYSGTQKRYGERHTQIILPIYCSLSKLIKKKKRAEWLWLDTHLYRRTHMHTLPPCNSSPPGTTCKAYRKLSIFPGQATGIITRKEKIIWQIKGNRINWHLRMYFYDLNFFCFFKNNFLIKV